jgi:hypothetical protein
MVTMNASKLQPALLGGLFTGVLSALPFISVGNCVCCLWVVCGGVLAVYLLQQNQAHMVEAGDGALVGLLSGLVGAVLATVLGFLIQSIMGPFGAEFLSSLADQASGLPPGLQPWVDQFATTGFGVAALIVGLVFNSILFSIFGMLGGLIGQAVFRKQAPPPTPVFLDPMAPRS